MQLTVARALCTVGLMCLVVGVSTVGASPKFSSTATILFPGGSLLVTFDEGGQRRFAAVDYELSANVAATSCTSVDGELSCITTATQRTATVTGIVPVSGRAAGSFTLAAIAGGGTICACVLHVDYSDITLTNLTSGRVYELEPISADSP